LVSTRCIHWLDRSRTRDSPRNRSFTQETSLELGGKSPFIIFETRISDGAVEGLVDRHLV